MRTHAYLWQTYLPHSRHPLDPDFLAEHPWVGTRAFVERVDRLALNLIEQCRPFLNQTTHVQWGEVPSSDVVCVDVAVTEQDGTWDLTPVELQAFTSIFATCDLAYRMQHALYDMRGLTMKSPLDNGSYARNDGSNPTSDHLSLVWPFVHQHAPETSLVIIEHHPLQQGTLFDLEALSYQLNAPLLHWEQVFRRGDSLFYKRRGRTHRIERIINRCIVHELSFDEQRRFVDLFGQALCSWHSHPAWYDLLNKSALTHLLDSNGTPYYLPASQWRDAPWAVEEMVLKQQHSCGGKDVLLHVTEDQLNALPDPEHWMVGPRYRSYSLSTQHPLYMEIRLMIALQPRPKVLWRMTRTFAGNKASRTHLKGHKGEGFGLLYRPTEEK